MLFRYFLFLILILFHFDFLLAANSSNDEYRLDNMIVDGGMIREAVNQSPKNVSVITELDWQQLPATQITDILATQANINLQNLYGHPKKAALDIRGMGVSAGSNVLVIVDGIKLNAPDMAGVDFSSLDLLQIAKIEVIRGAGGVVYGDGAVGGVINIITKKGVHAPKLIIQNSHGSYQTTTYRLNYFGKSNDLSFHIYGNTLRSKGYRENSDFYKKQGGLQLNYDLTSKINIGVIFSKNVDEYGLPGSINQSDLDEGQDPTTSYFQKDFGETSEIRVIGKMEINFNQNQQLQIFYGQQSRENNYLLGYNTLLDWNDQISSITDDFSNAKIIYTNKYKIAGQQHIFKCGGSQSEHDYTHITTSQQLRKNSDTINNAVYVMNQWKIHPQIKINFGYRENIFTGIFRNDQLDNTMKNTWIKAEEQKKTWYNNAYEMGVTYLITPQHNFFWNQATSFRLPNLDELALSDDDLMPQKGLHHEIGMRYFQKGHFKYTVTFFHILIQDEIYYGEHPDTQVITNRNYDEITKRQGLEFSVKHYLSQDLLMWGNYSYTEAVFTEQRTTVPLVPTHQANLGVEFFFNENLTLTYSQNFVGQRYDGNDEDNQQYDQLPTYSVVNTKLTYYFNETNKLSLSVNNLFNEFYTTMAYSGGVYPMPSRNFNFTIEQKF